MSKEVTEDFVMPEGVDVADDKTSDEAVSTKSPIKADNLVEEFSTPERSIVQRPMFAYWEVGGNKYRLKLKTAGIQAIEQKYKQNLMAFLETMPALSLMLEVVHEAMRPWHKGVTIKHVQALYDKYTDDGGNHIGISFEAKAIYGMMIDRVSLSIKNGWLDEDGKIYIHYSVADIMTDTGCGKNKILKCLKELEEDVRLIERKKQGQGRPDMIYVKNFAIEEVEEAMENISEVCNVNLKEFTTQTSRSPEYKPLEVYDVNPNNTENNNINYTNPILSIYTEDAIDEMDEYQAYSELIRENIDMDSLAQRYPYEQKDVQEIYDLIVETVVGKGGSMTISGQQYPRELVKSRFLKLNMSHVEYVMECLRKNTTKVYNIKAYLLAALFNAGATMSNYYRAEMNHDMPQFAG